MRIIASFLSLVVPRAAMVNDVPLLLPSHGLGSRLIATRIVCCILRRNKFRFGHAVKAVQGRLADVDVLADHLCGDAGLAQSQCQRIRQRQSPQGPLTVAEFIGHLSSVHPSSRCRLSMALLQ
jgi:hypothetical protein